jgi:hypothetical protein
VDEPSSTPHKSSPHLQSESLSPGHLPTNNPPSESRPPSSPEHRSPQDPPPENLVTEVFDAVANYELHQRYYLLAVRYTGYPYAFHTVGSCFAVRAEAYCRAGGMSRRQAGEDFYFIQKLAGQGGFTECRSTSVYPSPRPSDRVPFGTGPDISRQIVGGQLDASAKHPNDREDYWTGRDSRQNVNSRLDTSAKHPNDREDYWTGPDSRQNVNSRLDTSAKHPNDREDYWTGPDNGQNVNSRLDASAKHPNDREDYWTGPDSRQIVRSGLDASAKQTNERSTDGSGQDTSQLLPYLTYNPELFEHLRKFFALIPRFYLSGRNKTVPDINPDSDPGTATDGDMRTAAGADPMTVKQQGPKETLKKVPAAVPNGDPPAGTEREAPEDNAASAANGDPPAGTEREAPKNSAVSAANGDPPAGSEKAAVLKGVPPAGTDREAPKNSAVSAANGDPPAGSEKAAVLKGVPPLLRRYLEESGFWEELGEIRGNTASEGAFRKRFFGKFNMFWILKFLHFAEEHGVEKMEVKEAAGMMLEMWGDEHGREAQEDWERGLVTGCERGNEQDPDEDGPVSGNGSSNSKNGTQSREIGNMVSGNGSSNSKNGTQASSSTREMLLLYRKYFS